MGVVGQQFGSPSGLLGRLAGRFMARNNADVNRRLVDEVASLVPPPRVVAELVACRCLVLGGLVGRLGLADLPPARQGRSSWLRRRSGRSC